MFSIPLDPTEQFRKVEITDEDVAIHLRLKPHDDTLPFAIDNQVFFVCWFSRL
jgi:hypothetical protein